LRQPAALPPSPPPLLLLGDSCGVDDDWRGNEPNEPSTGVDEKLGRRGVARAPHALPPPLLLLLLLLLPVAAGLRAPSSKRGESADGEKGMGESGGGESGGGARRGG
jgi:hypothetical protein